MRPQAAVRRFKNVAFAAHQNPSTDHAPDVASIMDQSTKPVWKEAMGVVTGKDQQTIVGKTVPARECGRVQESGHGVAQTTGTDPG